MFDGVEGFLKVYAEDRKMRTKKDKVPQPSAIAQRIIAELPVSPGIFCEPLETMAQETPKFWPAVCDWKQFTDQVMTQQVAALSARGKSGPSVGALVIASRTELGPAVELVGALKVDEEPEMQGENDDDDDDDMDGEGEEEEEEYMEGEESEEDMSEDL